MHSLLYIIPFAFACMNGASATASPHGHATSASTTTITSTVVGYHASQSTRASAIDFRAFTASNLQSLCPRETVNHIFYPLPQQCLRTNRQSSPSTNLDTSFSTNSQLDNLSVLTVQDYPVKQSGVPELVESIKSVEQAQNASPPGEKSAEPASSRAQGATTTPKEIPKEEENDSPLDNVNFLSFEDWKKQNLANAGQVLDDVGRAQNINSNRQRPGIHNALDSLGEESEINLDFAGFGRDTGASANSKKMEASSASSSIDATDAEQSGVTPQTLRSKDAGKTCKERTNYASFDCAATVLKANKECKSASSVLVENKDSYMLNICSADNKFFIVELCDDILVDTIVLANYEFFSSSLRHFRVSVSDRYPAKADKWKDLGTFEARNSREVQAFLVQNPLIWARFIRIEFLTHYGNEYYCPVSLFRVHGTTMLEEFRHQEELAREEDDDATLDIEMTATTALTPPLEEAAVQPPRLVEAAITSTVTAIAKQPRAESFIASTEAVPPKQGPDADSAGSASDHGSSFSPESVSLSHEGSKQAASNTATDAFQSPSVQPIGQTSSIDAINEAGSIAGVATENLSSSYASAKSVTVQTEPSTVSLSSLIPSEQQFTVSTESSTRPTETSPPDNSDTASSSKHSGSVGTSNLSSVTQNATTPDRARSNAPSSPSSQQSQPPTQESFFKSVHKRLQQLESNSTLSLKYIEEQSRILRDAFSAVEKRQVSKTANFLTNLNSTVMSELNGFHQAYDRLFQSTVFELEGQREQTQREMLALSTRLSLVADELVWQKRMGILQSTLLLLCLGLALFSRAGSGDSEIPLMQQVVNRSTTALRASWESPPNSPSPGSRSPVSLFRRKLWRTNSAPGNVNNTDSEASRPGSEAGPDMNVEPPTPGSASPGLLHSEDEAEPDRDSSADGTDEEKIETKKFNGHGHARSKSLGLSNNMPRTRSPLAIET